jgi:amidohydrolase
MATVSAGAKEAANSSVDGDLDRLIELSHTIHAHPELAFEEVRATEWTSNMLAGRGFAVTGKVAGLATAYEATFGSGPTVVGLCVEYDALPGVGHACGHNIIAASSVGAALALAGVADDLGLTVKVFGTPAEEGGGGKAIMIDAGVFAGLDAAMMVHPWPNERLEAQCLAVSHFDVIYRGKSAHASAAPFEGINAGDALTLAQVAIGLARQQLRPGDQVHGIVTSGGQAANIIPDETRGRFMCRSTTIEALERLEPRIRCCFEAGAVATGASLEYESLSEVYTHMESDPVLLAAYRSNAEHLGRTFTLDDEGVPLPTISTDMANVSLVVPSIHPLIAIETRGAVNHQPEFTAACITDSADRAVRDGALALAWTAIDVAAGA